jgi:hypothetical protein
LTPLKMKIAAMSIITPDTIAILLVR